ncbi:unnamed protein product [Echinostoma caproni]|uniref:IFT81_CH domain-containing protein n=1 Tax=Echinostoma caproni TaxID=27848 RepID=A0A183B277_9TREM|nr:unnamed protein product [Echinostoma caproni]
MSETIRFITQKLNAEPFNKSFNLISFDSIESIQLLQLVNDRSRQIKRLTFRKGLVTGDKLVLYPILEWLLQRIPELKKRAYLAKFLVKIQVPDMFMQDDEISALYQQYESLMDTFKEAHKKVESLKTGGLSTAEVKRDIVAMQDEKDQLHKRVDRMKKKVSLF